MTGNRIGGGSKPPLPFASGIFDVRLGTCAREAGYLVQPLGQDV